MTGGSGLLSPLMRRLHAPVYAARQRELVRRIVPHLREGDRVLDVGCGYGALGRAILDDEQCPAGVDVRGLERCKRGGEAIPVEAYGGGRMPYEDDAFDIVILADVLHHEAQPDRLIEECRRVAARYVIIKDHQRRGLLARPRISLIDWAANAPYGVRCLFRYNSPAEWTASHRRHELTVVEELGTMRLYPPLVNAMFGGGLQYLAVLGVRPEYAAEDDARDA